jgi:hypothetical protein
MLNIIVNIINVKYYYFCYGKMGVIHLNQNLEIFPLAV